MFFSFLSNLVYKWYIKLKLVDPIAWSVNFILIQMRACKSYKKKILIFYIGFKILQLKTTKELFFVLSIRNDRFGAFFW